MKTKLAGTILARAAAVRNIKSAAVLNRMLGISTSSFYGKAATEEAIDIIAGSGAKCAEVFLNSFSEYESGFLGEVCRRLKQNGLEFASVHTLPTQFEPQLFAATGRQREDAALLFRRVLEGAAKGGCGVYVMHGKPFFKKNTSTAMNISKIADDLNELCGIANEYGIKIALENVHWAMCNSIEFVNEIKEKVRGLFFTLDIKQAHFDGNGYAKYIDAFGERLINVHICDYFGMETRMIGKGEVDFSDLKERLCKNGYEGNIIIELYGKDYNSIDEVFECVEFCKKVFG